MNRLRLMLVTAMFAGVVSGCSEDQPNAPAQPAEANPEFAAKSTDMMKAANSGMDLKKAKAEAAAAKKK
jgi:PBP1b-binding outer membrane lipoprotein LpoB